MASRVYLVQIRFADGADQRRILESMREINDLLSRMSESGARIAWTAAENQMVGLLLKSEKPARAIFNEIHSPMTSTASPFLSGDQAIVLEVGEDMAGNGFSSCWAFLQHR
ncbi:hypothetical protein [Algiphilus aromaticivorans]|uniref:hypothetical protein n=1 Tax=Algiphilus aromaticivorans TaxID=382454 RepID=UPI0005C20994|nr:hypothetical protein [Algiphilus aromaticivorans]